MSEKRKWPRINLRYNINFSSAQGNAIFDGSGITENISRGGMRFRTNDWKPLDIGQKLSFQMVGLSLQNPIPGYMKMSGFATVLRLKRPENQDSKADKAEVAVRFEKAPRIHA